MFPVTNPFNSANITIRQMASHLSGLPKTVPYSPLPDGTSCTSYVCNITNAQALQILSNSKVQLLFAPNTRPSYSNLAFSLLGRFITEYLNETYEDYLENNILNPIGLFDTVFYPNATQAPQLAAPYNKLGNPILGTPSDAYPDWQAPDEQLYGTPADMAKLINFLFDGDDNILNAAVKNELFSPLFVNGDGKTMYGMPFDMLFFKNNLLRMLTGSQIGYSSHMILIPELKLGVVALANTNADLSIYTLGATSILLDYYNAAISNFTINLPLNYTQYLGVYSGSKEDGSLETIEVKLVGGQIIFTDTRLPAGIFVLLQYQSNNQFIMHVRRDKSSLSCLDFYNSGINYDVVTFISVITSGPITSLSLQGLSYTKN